MRNELKDEAKILTKSVMGIVAIYTAKTDGNPEYTFEVNRIPVSFGKNFAPKRVAYNEGKTELVTKDKFHELSTRKFHYSLPLRAGYCQMHGMVGLQDRTKRE